MYSNFSLDNQLNLTSYVKAIWLNIYSKNNISKKKIMNMNVSRSFSFKLTFAVV